MKETVGLRCGYYTMETQQPIHRFRRHSYLEMPHLHQNIQKVVVLKNSNFSLSVGAKF